MKRLKYALLVFAVTLPTTAFALGYRSGITTFKILFAVGSLCLYLYTSKKYRKRVVKLQQKIGSQDSDPIWNIKAMVSHTRMVHRRMHEAMSLLDADHVRDLVTDDMYSYLTLTYAAIAESKQRVVVDGLDVTQVEIISTANYIDKTKDNYTAHITGDKQWAVISTVDGREYHRSKENVDDGINELYQFIRSDDRWLLCFIKTDPTSADISNGQHYIEATEVGQVQ